MPRRTFFIVLLQHKRIMKKNLLLSITAIALVLCSNVSFSQTLELGTLSSFEAYTGSCDIINSGSVSNPETFTGDVGTNQGTITGFGPPNTFTGTIHNNDALTVQARIDLLRV
jgi:hypothetical protein